MRYVSIDIETTGSDHNIHSILEFAAVIEDTEKDISVEELPHINFSFHDDNFVWDTDTILFHIKNDYFPHLEKLLKECGAGYSYLRSEFNDFIRENKLEYPIFAAGKNFEHFDRKFIEKIWPGFAFHSRTLDPSILYLLSTDTVVPNMKTCMERAGIKGEQTHRALDDARLVISLIRRGMK